MKKTIDSKRPADWQNERQTASDSLRVILIERSDDEKVSRARDVRSAL